MKTALPFSYFMHDRTAVIGGSNENHFVISMLYARPHGGHRRLT
jgi:hypothetical protein